MTGPRNMGPIDVWLYSMYRSNLRARQHTRQGEPLTVPERTFLSILLRVWCWWVQRKTTNSKEPSGSFSSGRKRSEPNEYNE